MPALCSVVIPVACGDSDASDERHPRQSRASSDLVSLPPELVTGAPTKLASLATSDDKPAACSSRGGLGSAGGGGGGSNDGSGQGCLSNQTYPKGRQNKSKNQKRIYWKRRQSSKGQSGLARGPPAPRSGTERLRGEPRPKEPRKTGRGAPPQRH